MNRARADLQWPPVAVVAGVRTPFAKSYGALSEVTADELGRVAVAEVIARSGLSPHDVGETVIGNVAGPAETPNIARVISLRTGIPADRPAHTVNRNCASGMESVFAAWQILREGRAEIVVAGGTESMSQVPLLWSRPLQLWLRQFRRASLAGRLKLLTRLSPGWLKPVVALQCGLTDPVCGLNMGQTAEILAEGFGISRSAQDDFALQSHQRATAAWDRCFYKTEVVPVVTPGPVEQGPQDGQTVSRLEQDVGPRPQQSLEALAKLRPFFNPAGGTVTAGNSCPISDGAAALLLMSPAVAHAHGLQPLGYLRGYAVAGCEPRRMGLGPVYATHKLLHTSGLSLTDFDLFEINEAFAAQVLACLNAFSSSTFAERELGRTAPIGSIDSQRLNIHGGAIALGHPVGASGTRLILTLLRALDERRAQRGLAALCVGGGQGAAVWVERTWEEPS